MKDIIERKFFAVVRIVQNLPKPGLIQTPVNAKLQLYALYKQATEGPNTSPKPNFWNIVRKMKWSAWKQLQDLSKEEAMQFILMNLLPSSANLLQIMVPILSSVKLTKMM
ncbi:hypothetical protein WDU94_012763 [Cyamophila willieti]